MSPVTPGGRRRLTVVVKDSLRELSIQLSLLNRRVGAQLDVRDVDWDCLEIINRHGPLSRPRWPAEPACTRPR